MKTLPLDLQTISHAQAVPTQPPHYHGFTSAVGSSYPAAHPQKWLLMYSELCNHHHSLTPKHLLSSPRNSVAISSPPHCHCPSYPSTPPLICCLSAWICASRTHPILGIIQDMATLTQPCVQGSCCITSGRHSFLWLNDVV